MDNKTEQEIEQFLHDILDNVDDTNIAKTERIMRENEPRAADNVKETTKRKQNNIQQS